MVVVPRLPERRYREPREVSRLVARRVGLAPEEVAERVDREGRVVQQEEPHRTRPQQRREPAGDRARRARSRARRGRRGRRAPRPRRSDRRTVRSGPRGDPSHSARVPRPRRRSGSSRRGRAQGRVSAPIRPWPWPWGLCGSSCSSEKRWCLRWLDTHSMSGPSTAAEPRTPRAKRIAGPRLEAAVSEEPVKAHGDADRTERIGDRERHEVGPREHAAPCLPGGEPEQQEGHGHDEHVCVPVEPSDRPRRLGGAGGTSGCVGGGQLARVKVTSGRVGRRGA